MQKKTQLLLETLWFARYSSKINIIFIYLNFQFFLVFLKIKYGKSGSNNYDNYQSEWGINKKSDFLSNIIFCF